MPKLMRTVHPGDKLQIGDVLITVVNRGKTLRMQIEAPKDVLIEHSYKQRWHRKPAQS